MAHHFAHRPTLTLPSRHRVARRMRRFEQKAARHWPFVAYALLSLSVAGYVVDVLVTLP